MTFAEKAARDIVTVTHYIPGSEKLFITVFFAERAKNFFRIHVVIAYAG